MSDLTQNDLAIMAAKATIVRVVRNGTAYITEGESACHITLVSPSNNVISSGMTDNVEQWLEDHADW